MEFAALFSAKCSVGNCVYLVESSDTLFYRCITSLGSFHSWLSSRTPSLNTIGIKPRMHVRRWMVISGRLASGDRCSLHINCLYNYGVVWLQYARSGNLVFVWNVLFDLPCPWVRQQLEVE